MLIDTYAPHFMDDWPPHSPDLSPIENVWQKVEHELWTASDLSWDDAASFERALVTTWSRVTADTAYLRHLFASLDKRIQGVIKDEGAQQDF